MRADARENYRHILAVARVVVAEKGAEASLRDIARKADVGLATLCRHFPTREALLDALLRENLDELTKQASEFTTSKMPLDALVTWFRDATTFTHDYSGVVALMAAALENEDSALHASCTAVRVAGAQLLLHAQREGVARTDIDGVDLFALMAALAWLRDQPSFEPRSDHLVDVIISAILTNGACESTVAV
jgi:AcrR family transcriptional regulator